MGFQFAFINNSSQKTWQHEMKANEGTMNKLYLRYLLHMFSADYLVIQSKINQSSGK